MNLLDAAVAAHTAGLCVIPAAVDGTKAPWPDGPRWAKYQTEHPSADQLHRWFADDGYPGMGLVCGAVSGGLEMLELEGAAVTEGIYDQFLARAAELGLLELVDLIADGYTEHTPSGGIHWLYRCTDPTGESAATGNTKLARRPAREEEKASNPGEAVVVLAETRGEGGFVVVAPSSGPTHPSGRPWELSLGGFDTIADITVEQREELFALGRSFDAMPDNRAIEARLDVDDARPGDDYNTRNTWAGLLEPLGWVAVYDHGGEVGWRRPGKTIGVSATTNHTGTDRLKVFSTSTQFDTETTYDRFGAYALLEHDGDLAAAARALRQTGYGAKTSGSTTPNPNRRTDEPDEYPVVIVNGRPLRDVSLELVGHLHDSNEPPEMYVRGGMLTRVRRDEKDQPIVEPMTEAIVRHRVSEVVNTMRANKDGALSHIFPPMEVMRDLVNLNGWTFPALEAVTEIPTLRPDGTVHTAAGYDPVTELLHVPARGLEVPAVAHAPSDDEIDCAIKLIRELLHDFPFDTPADAANAVGCLMTPLVRPAISGQIPLALMDAPEPGTGKGLLADIVCAIASGRPAAKKPMPEGDEEIRKMITSTLMEGSTVVVLDNIDKAIKSSSLAAALTAEVWADRLLGRSEIVKIPNRATWIATGNNLQVAGDLARRCYRIRLDARQARPYMRTQFLHEDLPGWTIAHRGELIWSLLTIARAWWAEGRKPANVPALGGFTPWAQTVGGILANVGITEFLGNSLSFAEDADQEAGDWEAFLATWVERWADEVISTSELVDVIDRSSEFRDQVPGELTRSIGTNGFSKTLGWALKRHAGRHYGDEGYRVVVEPKVRKTARWSVAHNGTGELPQNVTRMFGSSESERGRWGSRGSSPAGSEQKILGEPAKKRTGTGEITTATTPSTATSPELALTACTRCAQPADRLIPAEWDETQKLCPSCCEIVAAELGNPNPGDT